MARTTESGAFHLNSSVCGGRLEYNLFMGHRADARNQECTLRRKARMALGSRRPRAPRCRRRALCRKWQFRSPLGTDSQLPDNRIAERPARDDLVQGPAPEYSSRVNADQSSLTPMRPVYIGAEGMGAYHRNNMHPMTRQGSSYDQSLGFCRRAMKASPMRTRRDPTVRL